jgi:hypothetical protein
MREAVEEEAAAGAAEAAAAGAAEAAAGAAEAAAVAASLVAVVAVAVFREEAGEVPPGQAEVISPGHLVLPEALIAPV